MFPQLKDLISTTNFEVTTFEDVEKLREEVRTVSDQPYCFGVNIKKADFEAYDFEVEFSFDKFELPDTNLPAFNDLTQAPDIDSWDKWFKSGALTLYPYMTEFFARYHDCNQTGD